MGKYRGFSALFVAVVFALLPVIARAAETLSFNTSDGERIDGDLYTGGGDVTSVAIVAPGFAQHRQTAVMRSLCSDLSKKLDVFCFDFRGTGTSTGFYTFGENEPLDLQPILEWASSHYKNVNLVGLSLGAYASGRAAYLWPKDVTKLLLISCPTDLQDIITSGGVWDSILASIENPGSPELRTGADWFFRWGNLFADKPDLSALGPGVATPASFLVGQDDHLVFESLSRKVYDSFAGEKSWDIFQLGGHAEAMFIQNPPAFEHWVVKHLQTARLEEQETSQSAQAAPR